MNGSIAVTIITLFFCFSRFLRPIQGGICWHSMNNNGRCKNMLAMNTSREECCNRDTVGTRAWSEKYLDSGALFFAQAIERGVPCNPCRVSCEGVECGQGKKCVIRKGRPKCVCACNKKDRRQQGPLCGTDGESYLNMCRLKKEACRKKKNIEVEYEGLCQSSCDRVRCPEGNFCIVDQKLTPHCVECQRCRETALEPGREICGSDGVTYPGICQIRYAACTSGKSIPMAYRGRCRANVTCDDIKCDFLQECLTDRQGQPRCVTCNQGCRNREYGGPVCGTNNQTYASWCHMMADACKKGYVIETKSPGTCPEAIELADVTD